MFDPPIKYDAIIVGGGPAGLSAALMLARACRRVVVVDSGKPRNAAARHFHGFLGRDGGRPGELIADGRQEAAGYGVELIDDLAVEAELIETSASWRHATGFKIKLRGGRELAGRKLLFATGTCDEIPDIPGFSDCYGDTVHHCPYCDGWEHRGGRLLAFGADPEKAAGLGLALRGWSPQVTVLTNGAIIAQPEKEQLARNSIGIIEVRVLRLVCEGSRLRGVELADRGFEMADALFFNSDQLQHCELPKSLGCEKVDDCLLRTAERQKTNVPGLFLAGDADGDVQFVIVAAGEGATAAVTINRELQEEDRS